jgi:hypothetical protein
MAENNISTEDFYSAATGENNREFYLALFHRFDAQGIGPSWHWPAFFLTLYWLLHRKMGKLALVYVILPLPLAAADTYLFTASDLPIAALSLLYLVATFIVVPMYANAVYYWHLKSVIARARQEAGDEAETLQLITTCGGTRSLVLTIVVSLLLMIMLAVAAALREQVLGAGV